MGGRQAGIIGCDLGTDAARPIEEEDIVDGDDLCCLPRRDEQGMRGVHHVPSARQPLDRWPLVPVPCGIQQPYGKPTVDHVYAEALGQPGRWAICPGAAEEANLISCVSGKRFRERMDVFSDPGSLPKGWPIVYEDAHGFTEAIAQVLSRQQLDRILSAVLPWSA